MKYRECSFCDKKIYAGSNVFELNMNLFCSSYCANKYAKINIYKFVLIEPECEEDDAE